jgi:hypothetical protein
MIVNLPTPLPETVQNRFGKVVLKWGRLSRRA